MRAIEYIILTTLLFASTLTVAAQELEPRVYANLPTRLNAFALLYGVSKGNVLTEPTLPVDNFKITAHNAGMAYVRTFGLAKKLARVQLSVPFISMVGNLTVNGRDTSGSRTGLGDIRLRFGINIIGSEALTPQEFAKYQQKMIVGFSIVTSIPTGLYYADKRINIGSNRWGIKPEIGISKRFKKFYAEAYTGVWLYTANNSFLVNKKLQQSPVFSIQSHINYMLSRKLWLGANANWFNGGATRVNDEKTSDLGDNWRVGGICSYAINFRHTIKLQFHVGAFTSAGYDYNILLLSYQFTFFDKFK